MIPVFADTFYFIALSNPRDAAHRRAVASTAGSRRPMLTTWFVLLELADAMCRPPDRVVYLRYLDKLLVNPNVRVRDATPTLLLAGLDLYRRRPDKAWSLTDCTSFVAMRQEGVVEALTADHHFEQAGFVALLK